MSRRQGPECEFDGVRDRSEAHAWPKKYYRQVEQDMSLPAKAKSVSRFFVNGRVDHQSYRRYGIKTMRVCAPCNTGFLNQIETPAWDRLTPMMALTADGQISLDLDAQRELASWATGFSMVSELCPTAKGDERWMYT